MTIAKTVPSTARLAIAAVIGALAISGCDNTPTDPCKDNTAAWVMAENFIKNRLKAPSTADFPWYTSEGTSVVPSKQANGRCSFIVKTYVDAENSFGAKLRSRYIVEVAPEGSGETWQLISINEM